VGRLTAGDGRTTATWELGPAPGLATIALTTSADGGDDAALTAVAVEIPGQDAPTDAW
jgi:hypothetical protein